MTVSVLQTAAPAAEPVLRRPSLVGRTRAGLTDALAEIGVQGGVQGVRFFHQQAVQRPQLGDAPGHGAGQAAVEGGAGPGDGLPGGKSKGWAIARHDNVL